MEDNVSATYTSEQMLAKADAHYFQEFKMTASMLRYAVAEINRTREALNRTRKALKRIRDCPSGISLPDDIRWMKHIAALAIADSGEDNGTS